MIRYSQAMRRGLMALTIMMSATVIFSATAVQQENAQETSKEREELKERFKQRHASLSRLLQQGKAGETWLGYVEPIDRALVNPDDERLLEQENADRKRLYELIAQEVVPGKERIPPDIVAERNAKRNFRQAQPDEYLKISEGRWIQKKNENRTTRLERLKREGDVGETWRGQVESVDDRNLSSQARNIVEQENRDRQRLYERIAEARGRDVSADEVAREAGKEILQHIAPGHYYLPRDGKWTRKPGRERDRN